MNTISLEISSLQDSYASNESTPADVVRGVYRSISAAGESAGWVDILAEDEAVRRAEALGINAAELPLYGVPFLVGNNIDLAGAPTTCMSNSRYTPARSAAVVERLIAAGAIPIGKTKCGGSAVAAGLASFALETVMTGSGCASAVALKPTHGAVSTSGVFSSCRSLDGVTIFSNSCPDARRVLQCAVGFEADDPLSRRAGQRRAWSPKAFRFGAPPPELLGLSIGSSARSSFENASAALEKLGGTRVQFDFAILRNAAQLLCDGPWNAEKAASHSALATFEAIYRQAELARAAEHEWTRMDFLLLPEQTERCGADFVQLLDVSAVTIPVHASVGGIRLIGPAWSDEALLRTAGRLFPGKPIEDFYCPDGYVPLAVCGAHLAGQPLNHQLTSAGAFLIEKCSTSPNYRLYALRGTIPAKPGLVRAKEGAAIELEVWAVPEDKFGVFVAAVPPPLAIGSCTLACGRTVKSFVCEPRAIEDAEEITHLGGWRNYVSRV